MSETVIPHLGPCFAAFPGAVMHLSPGGRVMESNGQLERELGKAIIGERFSEIIDAVQPRYAKYTLETMPYMVPD